MKRLIAKLFGRRPNKQSIDVRNIGSVLLKPIGHAVGDAIVHIAHLNQLKKAFPDLKIGVIVSERNKRIFTFSGIVDVLVDDRLKGYWTQRKKWDLYLDFMPGYTSRSIFLDYLLYPEIVINFGKTYKKHYNLDTVKNYDVTTVIPEFTHIRDYLSVSVLAPHLIKEELYYSLPKLQNIMCNDNWQSNGIKILLNPHGSNRQLPPAELIGLLKGIKPEFYSQIELLLTNTDGSEHYLTQLKASPLPIRLASKSDILQYFHLIDSADIVVAVDGGAVHIACAYAKPLLAFYANHKVSYMRWAVAPKENVSTCMLITEHEKADNTGTEGFDMEQAACWLNARINEMQT